MSKKDKAEIAELREAIVEMQNVINVLTAATLEFPGLVVRALAGGNAARVGQLMQADVAAKRVLTGYTVAGMGHDTTQGVTLTMMAYLADILAASPTEEQMPPVPPGMVH